MVVIHTPIKMVTFGPWIPCSDEEDIPEEVSSSAKADQVVCEDVEELITLKQDEAKEMVAAKSAQLVDIPIAEDAPNVDTIKIKPEVDGSFAKVDEVAKCKTKSAAQIFMEEKRAAGLAKEKIREKLTLLEEELKLGQRLLLQAQTLRKSKEALLMQKVRVTYNKCHKFWRGSVISTHKSFVDAQVDAAKARLGLRKCNKIKPEVERKCTNKFDISAMVTKIDELAPSARYKSANPLPASTARPWARTPFVKKEETAVRYFTVPIPSVPIQQRGERIARAQLARASSHQQPTSAGYRGEQSIVSHGDDLAEDQCYDHSTQLEPGTDEFLWDGQFDYPCHEEQVEVDNSDIIWEDANELEVESGFYDEELEVACYYDDEVATCFDAEDVVCYSDAEVADYYYLGNEDCYDY